MKTIFAVLFAGAIAAPLAAQSRAPQPRRVAQRDADDLSVRAVGFFTGEQFAAQTTFEAVFGDAFQKFFGGGVSFSEHGVFFDITASRFKKTGQRAVILDGEPFGLNIPLTATITPIEFTAGYRFLRRSSIIPYAGGGFGSYHYTETSSFSIDASEDVDTRHVGYLAVGGAEFRVHRLVGIAGEVQYTHIPGILGLGGLSKDAGEDDLGGTAIRVKVIVGRR